MVAFSIETVGEERFVRAFNRISDEVQDFQEPFRIILGDFRETESRILATEGSSEGEGRFAPLSGAYRAWKERHFPGRRIMYLRGYLTAALTGKSEGTVERIEKRSAEFGTDIIYAHRHQMGTAGMPMRRIVQVNDAVKMRWGRVIVRWAAGLFDKHGVADYSDYRSTFGRS